MLAAIMRRPLLPLLLLAVVSRASSDGDDSSPPSSDESPGSDPWGDYDPSDFPMDGPGCAVRPIPWQASSASLVCDGLYIVWDAFGFGYSSFIVTTEGVIVMDCGRGMGAIINEAVKSVTDIPITHAIYNHHHMVHAGEMHLLESPVPITYVASRDTAIAVAGTPDAGSANPIRPPPTLVFDGDEQRLTLGNVTLELSLRPVHSVGQTWVYSRHHKVLLGTDTVVPGDIPAYVNFVYAGFGAFFDMMEEMVNMDIHYVVATHWDTLATFEDVQSTYQLCVDLHDAALQATINVPFVLDPNPATRMDTTAIFFDDKADECARIMVEEYGWGTAPGKQLNGLLNLPLICHLVGFQQFGDE